MHSFIDDLIRENYLKTPVIISAFRKIKREDFVSPGDEEDAEIDAPLPIGAGQTISQPLTVALILELLKPEAGDKVLDIGSGSGWTSALLAEIVGGQGKVYAIEVIPELKKFGEENIGKYNFIKSGRVKCFLGDGRAGLPEFAPFDRILVSAATEEAPEKLLEQLKVGGRLVVPIGRKHESQELVLVEKIGESEFRETRFPGFVFVPLV